MKGFMKKTSVALLVLAGFTGSAFAADESKINISGIVNASSCEVENGGEVNVTLDPIEATDLATPGSAGAWKEFQLKLVRCPGTTTNTTASFNGTPADNNADMYKSSGEAKNLEIELQNAAGANMGNGKSYSVPVNQATNDAVYSLKTRAYTKGGNATPGTIVGTLVATFTYQ